MPVAFFGGVLKSVNSILKTSKISHSKRCSLLT